jgi:hypothetical protein
MCRLLIVKEVELLCSQNAVELGDAFCRHFTLSLIDKRSVKSLIANLRCDRSCPCEE